MQSVPLFICLPPISLLCRSSPNLKVLADERLAQLNVLLLSIGLRGTRIDNLLPSLALRLALCSRQC